VPPAISATSSSSVPRHHHQCHVTTPSHPQRCLPAQYTSASGRHTPASEGYPRQRSRDPSHQQSAAASSPAAASRKRRQESLACGHKGQNARALTSNRHRSHASSIVNPLRCTPPPPAPSSTEPSPASRVALVTSPCPFQSAPLPITNYTKRKEGKGASRQGKT